MMLCVGCIVRKVHLRQNKFRKSFSASRHRLDSSCERTVYPSVSQHTEHDRSPARGINGNRVRKSLVLVTVRWNEIQDSSFTTAWSHHGSLNRLRYIYG